ncbi:hypothetical protein CC78DRAFT_528952 [Lojkania enalia]|uniref:Translation initiation factor 3 C-terminal domain-containing protein n=1 Tax=Lojkania enalia TaxID=147567 RepID=A0A9P4TQU3_9PLEO|nr:hypothetical protein CC78DRAFT_528952 [Didymosphaeria enalia]
MPSIHISSTSRALYRVFIAPHVRSPFRGTAHTLPNPAPLPWISIRTIAFKKDTARHALSDHFTLDRAINEDVINLVDADNNFRPNIPMHLVRWNRTTHHLMLLQARPVDKYGHPYPDKLATCKIVTKIELRRRLEKALEAERKRAKGNTSAGPSQKTLELNWAIGANDLKHRLEKMKAFLKQGRKVEVMLGPKRRGREATREECENVLKSIQSVVVECKGATEIKQRREGAVGGVMTIVFQGAKTEENNAGEG